jgi:hypothetical protein
MHRGISISALLNILVFSSIIGAERVDYVRDIKPLLAKHCVACHSPLRQKSGFRIDTAALVIQGGELGPAVVPGNSSQSRLIHALTGSDGMSQMPPDGEGERLSADQIALVRRWIDEGAEAPVEPPAGDPRSHWAYQPLVRPTVPQLKITDWVLNPIDAFIGIEHERRGLKARPEAERHVLLRRVYLDLTGLPPTRTELQDFLADQSPTAYEQVVERLLASPRYGERWGRHWMDVWRYSDWAGWGQQVRDSQPHIWHWRDWIIETLNDDRPYDEMVVDMIAADEVAPLDRDRLRATGFLARNFKLLSREQWLQDTVEHTSKAFLGLTMNCARCHDHMTDPIDQEEYYRFRAIFEPHHVRLDRIPGTLDTSVNAIPRVFDKEPTASTAFFIRGDERNPQKDRAITPGVPALLQGPEFPIGEISLPRDAYEPERQSFVISDLLVASRQKIDGAQKKLDEQKQRTPVDASGVELAELELAAARANHASLEATLVVEKLEDFGDSASDAWMIAAKQATAAQRQAAIADSRRDVAIAQKELHAARTELDAAREKAGGDEKSAKLMKSSEKFAAAEKKVGEAETKRMKAESEAGQEVTTKYAKRAVSSHASKSTGRRLALARWIVDPRNPLTARVAVNHIWSRHFHSALIPSVFNFGVSGEQPINQPLLDWLASELMHPQYAPMVRPWTMKHIHRLIVTSRTYRLASTTDAENKAIDPDNRLLWSAPTRRMEAEVVRDSAFYVAGQLDLSMGGPDIDYAQGLAVKRRSLYFRHAAEKQMLFLKLFDCASVGECYERRTSVIPQQALALANSELTLVQARLLARQLDQQALEPQAFVVAAIEHVLARPADEQELSLCLEFLAQQEQFFTTNQSRLTNTAGSASEGTKPSADPKIRAREQLVHALLNHNDFVTIR